MRLTLLLAGLACTACTPSAAEPGPSPPRLAAGTPATASSASSAPSAIASSVALAAPSAEPASAVEPVEKPAPPVPAELLSPALKGSGLHSPMPGGFLGGWYGDTGLDIAGRYLPVYALGAGTLDYSERGHTLWTGKGDTPFSVRLRLDEPIAYKGHRVTHVYYTHLSKLATEQAEGSARRRHVVAGEQLGESGIGNGVAHLHLGLLLDDQVEQDSWEFILREGDVRKVMGDYPNGYLLPKPAKKR